ncbi:TPA: redoxin domain-containing protein [Candidatus Poribacteria bacterium]|nr:redoxin domain-containing protein [Candidatus Poribacteria bacterium]
MTTFLKCEIGIILVCMIIWGLSCVEQEEIINPVNPESSELIPEPSEPIIGNEVGNQAPEFSLPDENGNLVSLSDYKDNNNIILLFHTGST